MNIWYENMKKQILWQMQFRLEKLILYRDYTPSDHLFLKFYSDKELVKKLKKLKREYHYQLSRLRSIKNFFEMYSIDYGGG